MSTPGSAPSRAGLVLASSSPYRRELLGRLGLPFVWQAPDVTETPHAGEAADALVSRLAMAKARALAARYPRHYIVGSDQAATLDGRVIGKPGSREAAARQLARASGRTLVFHTAVCVLDTARNRLKREQIDCEVEFRRLSARQIDWYLTREPAFDCVGSFKSEALGVALCERIESPDPTALVGLPLLSVVRLLARLGCDVLESLTSPD